MLIHLHVLKLHLGISIFECVWGNEWSTCSRHRVIDVQWMVLYKEPRQDSCRQGWDRFTSVSVVLGSAPERLSSRADRVRTDIWKGYFSNMNENPDGNYRWTVGIYKLPPSCLQTTWRKSEFYHNSPVAHVSWVSTLPKRVIWMLSRLPGHCPHHPQLLYSCFSLTNPLI